MHNNAALWSFPQFLSQVVRGGSDKPLKSRIFHLNWSQAMCRRLTTHPYWQWEPSDPLIYLCALSQWEVSNRGARLVWQMRPGRPGNLDPLYKDGQFWATQRLLPSATRQQRNTTTVWTIFFFWSSRQGPKDVFDKVQSLKKIHNSAQVWVTETKETKTRQSLCVPHTHTCWTRKTANKSKLLTTV